MCVQLLRVECRYTVEGSASSACWGLVSTSRSQCQGAGPPVCFPHMPSSVWRAGLHFTLVPSASGLVVQLLMLYRGCRSALPPAQHTLSTVNPKSHRLAGLCFCVQGLEPLPPLTAQTVLLRLSRGPRVVCSTFRICPFNPSNYPCERVVLLLFDVSSNSSSPCCF